MSEIDYLTLLILTAAAKRRRALHNKRKHSFWIHPIIRRRKDVGAYNSLIMTDLNADNKQFQRYFRMNKRQFEDILQAIGPSLRVRMYHRETVSPREQLAITLR